MSKILLVEDDMEISTVPIIIISTKDTASDKTLGLGLGSDDYITKPFSVTEVLARMKANIRRNTQYAASATEQQPILQDVEKSRSKSKSSYESYQPVFYISQTGIWRYKYKSWQSQYQRDMQGECFGVL